MTELSPQSSDTLTFQAFNESLPLPARKALLRALIWTGLQTGHLSEPDFEKIDTIRVAFQLSPEDFQQTLLEAQRNLTTEEVLTGLQPVLTNAEILQWLLGAAIFNGIYDARQRNAILRVARVLEVEQEELNAYEAQILVSLQEVCCSDADRQLIPSETRTDKSTKSSNSNLGLIIFGGLACGALLAVTAGAAAPAIGGFVGTTFLGLSGAAATSGGLALFGGGSVAAGGLGMAGGKVVIASLFGVAGAALGAKKTAHRWGDLKEFQVEELTDDGSRIVLGISGFLSQHEDFQDHWRGLREFYGPQHIHALRWESKALRDFGKIAGMGGASFFANLAGQEGAKKASKMAAGAIAYPLWALNALNIIDNPWSVARDRAEKAGLALADVLREQPWGQRPVTLVGFSLGTRVIVHALAALKEDEIAQRIDSVILLGGAIGAQRQEIDLIRHAVSGPIVNGYCTTDVVLSYIYRTTELGERAIGLGPLERPHILDVDLSDLVSGHMEYNSKLPQILERVHAAIGNHDPETWVH